MACMGDFRFCVGNDDQETIEVVASAQISNGKPSIGYSHCGTMCNTVQEIEDDHDLADPTTMTPPLQDDESHHPSETEMLSDEEDEGRASPSVSVSSLAEEDPPQGHPELGEKGKERYRPIQTLSLSVQSNDDTEVEEANDDKYSSLEADFKSPPKFIHHVDARTKAEGRKAELETLRRMNLTRTQAKGLVNAAAPLEMANFFEKQRAQTLTQRKSQHDAKEFLHQYRADDELVLKDIKRTASRDSSGASPRHAASASSAPAYATMSEIDSFFRQKRQHQQSWNKEQIKFMEILHTYRSQEPLLTSSSADSNSLVKDPHPVLLVSASSENMEVLSYEWDDRFDETFSSIQKALNYGTQDPGGSPLPETPRGYKSKLAAKAALPPSPRSPVQDFDSRTKALSELLALAIQDPLPESPVPSILKPKKLDSPRAVPALPDSKEIPTRPSEEEDLNMDSIEITLVSMPEKIHKLPVKESTNPKTPRKESTYPIKTSTDPESPAIKQSTTPNESPAGNKTVEKESKIQKSQVKQSTKQMSPVKQVEEEPKRSPRKDLIMKGKRHRPKLPVSIPESQEWTEEKTRDNSGSVDASTLKAPTPTKNAATHSANKIQRPDNTKQTRRSAADADLVEKSSPDSSVSGIVNIAGSKEKEVEHLDPTLAEGPQMEPSSLEIPNVPSDECKEKSSPEKKHPEAPSSLKDCCKISNSPDPVHGTIDTKDSDETTHLSRDSYIAIQTSRSGLESLMSVPVDAQTLETVEPGHITIVPSKDNQTGVLQWAPPASSSSLGKGNETPGRTNQADIPTVNSYKSSVTAHSYKSSATAHIDACLTQDFVVLSMDENEEEALTPKSALDDLLRIDSSDEDNECNGEDFGYTSALDIEPSESKDTISIDPGLVAADPSSSNETPAIAAVEEEKKLVYEDVTEDEARVFSILNSALAKTSPQKPVDPDTHVFSILNAALEDTSPQTHADPFMIVEPVDQKTEGINVSVTLPEPVNEMVEDTADSVMVPESVDSYDSAPSSDNSFSIDHRSFRSGAFSAVLPPAPVVDVSTAPPKDYTVPLAARAGFSTPENSCGYPKSAPVSSQPAIPRSSKPSGIVAPQIRTPMKRPTAPTHPSSVRAASAAGGKAPNPFHRRRSDPYAVTKRNQPKPADPSPVPEKPKRELKLVPLYLRKPPEKKQKEKDVICGQKYDPHLHKSLAGCERCLYWASPEEQKKFEEKGHHLRIMMVRGGCDRGCAVFAREKDEFPVRLCVKCYYDTHKKELSSSEWGDECQMRFH